MSTTTEKDVLCVLPDGSLARPADLREVTAQVLCVSGRLTPTRARVRVRLACGRVAAGFFDDFDGAARVVRALLAARYGGGPEGEGL